MKDFLKTIIKEGGQIAKDYFDKGVHYTTKAHLGDLLTEADTAVSEFLVGKILEKHPDHHILSEELEEEINPVAQYEWVIDPIDGTRNFANGIGIWCTMIAVLRDGEQYLSAVYDALADELFFAEAGHGATLNGMPISVNTVESLDHSAGVCVRTHRDPPSVDRYKKVLVNIVENTNMSMGNHLCAIGMCYLAAGGLDFFLSNAGYDYDWLPVTLIAREAGAVVTDSEGNPWKRGRMDLVVANPKLHPKVMELFE